MFTSPAASPLLSVTMVSAETGCTARAKPVARLVTTKPRRVSGAGGMRLIRWLSRSSKVPSVCWTQPGPSLEPGHYNATDSHENLLPRRDLQPPDAEAPGKYSRF